MTRHSRKLTAIPSHHSDLASSTQSELPLPRSLPPQLPTLLQDYPKSSSSAPLHLRHPTALTQAGIPVHDTLSPPTSAVPLQHVTLPVRHASPAPATPPPAFTAPPVLLDPETMTSASRTSSQAILPSISSSSTPPPHFHGHGMFHMAQNFTISNSHFIDFSPTGFGLERLLNHSMPDAFYNSSARYPPPKCHLGTRNDYIDLVTKWALGESDRKKPILWMRGPFGTGKSAVAQSCAEALVPMNKLAATLFFSRSNPGRDDPRRVFTSIAYQIATKCPSIREIVDRRMLEDPALAMTSLSTQFEELLVRPLREIDATGSGLDGRVVIIDGLDECHGTAEQREIIRLIGVSARKHTTPFRWFITSRPEGAIIRTMNSATVSSVCSRLELPVSRAIDHEILLFLTDEFKKIQEDHDLPESWPPEAALALLVEHGAGLWIYVATMVRFIKDENSYGPKDQLRTVVEFANDISTKVERDNPLAEMDYFYTLIVERVPLMLRITVRQILLACSTLTRHPANVAAILGLSEEKFRRACASIQSVMELHGSELESMTITFHHTSFLDFMKDSHRSKELCIHGDFLIGYRRELLGRLYELCSRSTGSSHIVFPSGTVFSEGVSRLHHYFLVLVSFWELCGVPEHPLDSQTAVSLAKLPFGKMLRLRGYIPGWLVNAHPVRDNLPAEFRDKVVRNGKCPIPGCTITGDVWILGHGENESVPKQWNGGFVLGNNEDLPDGKCFCGARRRTNRDL
ncbi:hypothetical protein D9756_010666 [Leucocoprinus leucothites]|uniref:Nephrocystin 3-like N-terminal domain-containing protein n=1 Tax=Leucocoprinus leucothites TaxID=201217 RepID=A0A8H5FSN1_9AGAR|nr:hypothetical protein D9756_010666 [Leucoagaricus leucothites]